MQHCLIIGAGGIGSWLIARLARLRDYNQLDVLDSLVVADYDEVEDKNLPYQNFDVDEIMDSKAMCLDARYGINGMHRKITDHTDLESFNIIICAVDNPKARKLVFEHCDLNPEKYFIDLRAEGTAVMAMTSDVDKSLKELIATLGNEDAGDKSCQLAYELEAGIIQVGNTIISEIGAQWLLNHLRGILNPVVFTQKF